MNPKDKEYKMNPKDKAIRHKSLLRKIKSKEELIQIWKKELYPKFSEKAKNSGWLRNNKYGWFVSQVRTRFGKWSNFLKEMGHKSLLRKISSKEELIQIWKKELYPKYGLKAANCQWLRNNKYGWFVAQITKSFGKWSVSKRFFKQIKNKGTVTVKCPDCDNYFGLSPNFIDKTADTLIQYNCPYCDKKHLLEQ